MTGYMLLYMYDAGGARGCVLHYIGTNGRLSYILSSIKVCKVRTSKFIAASAFQLLVRAVSDLDVLSR
jgi:hypothetical protein